MLHFFLVDGLESVRRAERLTFGQCCIRSISCPLTSSWRPLWWSDCCLGPLEQVLGWVTGAIIYNSMVPRSSSMSRCWLVPWSRYWGRNWHWRYLSEWRHLGNLSNHLACLRACLLLLAFRQWCRCSYLLCFHGYVDAEVVSCRFSLDMDCMYTAWMTTTQSSDLLPVHWWNASVSMEILSQKSMITWGMHGTSWCVSWLSSCSFRLLALSFLSINLWACVQ